MKKLGPAGRNWLKGIHLTFVCTWIGAAASMLLVTSVFRASPPTEGESLFAVNSAIKLIDDFIVIPSALGCLLSGLVYSLFTNWGFFRHHWVTVKWVVTLATIIFGTFWLGPWLNGMTAISGKIGLTALSDPEYLSMRQLNTTFGYIQVAVLIATVFISVFKPWKRKTVRES